MKFGRFNRVIVNYRSYNIYIIITRIYTRLKSSFYRLYTYIYIYIHDIYFDIRYARFNNVPKGRRFKLTSESRKRLIKTGIFKIYYTY